MINLIKSTEKYENIHQNEVYTFKSKTYITFLQIIIFSENSIFLISDQNYVQ